MRAALVILLIAAALLMAIAEGALRARPAAIHGYSASFVFADEVRSRRPNPRLWQEETAAWRPDSAILSAQSFPDYDKPDPAVAQVRRSESSAKFTSGTAFAVGDGVWLTARHVVDHCRQVTIEGGDPKSGEHRLLVADTALHPAADAAVLRTASGATVPRSLPLAPGGADAPEAFHVGFPRSQPGAIYSRFMGRTTLRWIGTAPIESETVAWAAVSRVPDFGNEIGGMSGGLAMGPYGAAIGIVSAGSSRRGRILTTQPADVWGAIRRAGLDVAARGRDSVLRITDRSYPVVARAMIRERRVARVICEVGHVLPRDRRPPPR